MCVLILAANACRLLGEELSLRAVLAKGWGEQQQGLGTVALAGGTWQVALPSQTALGQGLWHLLRWEVVTARPWAGLLEPPARGGGGGSADHLVPGVCPVPPSPSDFQWGFSKALQGAQ